MDSMASFPPKPLPPGLRMWADFLGVELGRLPSHTATPALHDANLKGDLKPCMTIPLLRSGISRNEPAGQASKPILSLNPKRVPLEWRNGA